MKRSMLHFGSEKLGDVEWWPRDREILLKARKEDGSWGDVESTAYAVLSLHHPRPPLSHDLPRRK